MRCKVVVECLFFRRKEEEEKRLAEEFEKKKKADERERRVEAGEDPVEVDREIYGIIPESEIIAQKEAEEAAAAAAAAAAAGLCRILNHRYGHCARSEFVTFRN